MRSRLLVISIFPFCLTHCGNLFAEDKPARQEIARDQATRSERDRFLQVARSSAAKGAWAAAVEAATRAADLTAGVAGKSSLELADVLALVGEVQFGAGDYAQASSAWNKVHELRAGILGPGNWQTIDARIAGDRALGRGRLDQTARQRLAGADQQTAQALHSLRIGKPEEARPLAMTALATRRTILGDNDPEVGTSLHNAASIAAAARDFAAAEPLFVLAQKKIGSTYTTGHPVFARCLFKCGRMYMTKGDQKKAAELLNRSATIYENAQGKHSVGYVGARESLGWIAQLQGDQERCEAIRREVFDLAKSMFSADSPDYAFAVANLGQVLSDRGKHAEAVAVLNSALKPLEKIDSAPKLTTALCLASLGSSYSALGRSRDSVSAYERALEVGKAAWGENTEQYLRTKVQLGLELNVLGEYSRALTILEECAAARKKHSGPTSLAYALSLSNVATVRESRGDYAIAERVYREALSIAEANPGKADFQRARLVESLSSALSLERKYDEAQRGFESAAAMYRKLLGDDDNTARVLTQLGLLEINRTRHGAAEKAFEEALAIEQRVHGPESLPAAELLEHLGDVSAASGDFGRTEERLAKALRIRRGLPGLQRAELARALDRYALKAMTIKPEEAKAAFFESRDIRRELFGDSHAEYATSLHNISMYFLSRGLAAEALPLSEQAVKIRETAPGLQSADLSEALSTLGVAYGLCGRMQQAEAALLRAADLQASLTGEKRASYAATLQGLGLLYGQLGDYESMNFYCGKAVDVCRETFSEKSYLTAFMEQSYGLSLIRQPGDGAEKFYADLLERQARVFGERNVFAGMSHYILGGFRAQRGRDEAAEGSLRKAVEIFRQQSHGGYPQLAFSLVALANVRAERGALDEADTLLAEASEKCRKAVGTGSPAFALCLSQQAALSRRRGKLDEAESLYNRELELRFRFMNLAFDMFSERQQIAFKEFFHGTLDCYLSLRNAVPVERAYQQALRWKGAVFLRQRLQGEATRSPEVAAIYEELEQLTGQLVSAAFSTSPNSREVLDRISVWTRRKETLERKLAAQSAPFRRRLESRAMTPDRVREVLPKGAVLVDFIEYSPGIEYSHRDETGRANNNLRQLAAFVVRPDEPIKRFDLGPSATIGNQIENWRRTYERKYAEEVRRLVWRPIEESVKGAKVVLFSCDGPLHRFPWPALPGSRPDQDLIDELPVVLVPVPQLLPELLAGEPRAPNEKALPPGELLLIGGLNYGKRPANKLSAGTEQQPSAAATATRPPRSTQRGGDGVPRFDFPPLPGAEAEIAAIEKLWQQSQSRASQLPSRPASKRLLQGDSATLRELRACGPRSHTIHFSTHGFFLPQKRTIEEESLYLSQRILTSAGPLGEVFGAEPAISNPAMQSGLALSKANEFDQTLNSQDEAHEGILTAADVSHLDLHRTDLVVLSACDTGLGKDVSAEGVHGLQQAFEGAGSRTVIASLWKVDDAAATVLMSDFYRNRWEKRVSKLEALRQAQIAMKKRCDPATGRPRGLDIEQRDSQQAAPFYWAAFVLSGDWR